MIDIIIEDQNWRRLRGLHSRLKKAEGVLYQNLPVQHRLLFTVTVLLTNNKTVRGLNRDFRGMDKSTNVLSFPQFTPRELPKKGKVRQSVYMGDIVLAYQYVVGEAKKDHKVLINHVTHLFLHGLLHLFGYDHISATAAARMEKLEKRIMAELGLPDPYADRPPKPRKR